MSVNAEQGLYIVLVSVHGLIRGRDLELGRDSDTGGQTKYVVELARALGQSSGVSRVDLLTRAVTDDKVSKDYSVSSEPLGENAYIVRIPFGPRRYVRKERLWMWIQSFVDGAIDHFRRLGRTPDLVHGHYADGGLVAGDLSALLGVPMAFTGHSLGIEKRQRLIESGVDKSVVESRYNIAERIEAEENALSHSSLVVASTNQEANEQYALYSQYRRTRTLVIPPGVDLDRFRPLKRYEPNPDAYALIARFLEKPHKPWILALSRPDERKNIGALLEAYGGSKRLQELANLVVVAGPRHDITAMDRGQRTVFLNMLLAIDRYDLYGKVAYPKRHDPDQVPGLYRVAARFGGVFVNPALTEPFGLTLIEAAASGLPLVATDDGGPRDILARCKNGLLTDPTDVASIEAALFNALSDKKRWKRWSESGLRAVRRYYTWEGHVRSYLSAARRLVAREGRRKRGALRSLLPVSNRLLIADIDNTLIGDSDALAKLAAELKASPVRIGFGIATGRRLASAVKVLRERGAPRPDFFITAVGTEIHYGPRLVPDHDWAHTLDYRWNADTARETLEGMRGLKLQAKSEQLRFKVSYFIDPAKAPPLRQIVKTLRTKGLHVKAVFSHGQFLDILPVRASKGMALRYLANRWHVPMDCVLAAGDSGNDEEMLLGANLGVVVGNHSEELEKLRGRERVYFASRTHAGGILEGAEHYDFFAPMPNRELI